MNAYTTLGLDGATATASGPHGLDGSPLAPLSSVQDAPPSLLLNKPLPLGASGPSPPDRNVHPLRRKSHIPAKIVFGFVGSSDRIEHPVESFYPFSTFTNVWPRSVAWWTPRSPQPLNSFPG